VDILTENDITGSAAKGLRERAGMRQKAFWASLGLTQSGGSRYEQGQTIPRSIRILMFAMYVAGVNVDATTEEGAAELIRLAKLQASEDADDKEIIGAKMMEAMNAIKVASRALSSITNS
jgi:transcriptional regulator with XRE-family HTH domain